MSIKCLLGFHYPVKDGKTIFCKRCGKGLEKKKEMHKHIEIKKIIAPFRKNTLDIGGGENPLGSVNVDVDPSNKKADIIIEENKKLPFSKESFDCVVCSDVLEHIDDPKFLLGEINRVLKKRGLAVLSVPNSGHFLFRIGLWKQNSVVGEEHKQFWNRKEFESLLEKKGFRIKSFIPSYYYFGNKTLFRLLPSLCFCMVFAAVPIAINTFLKRKDCK